VRKVFSSLRRCNFFFFFFPPPFFFPTLSVPPTSAGLDGHARQTQHRFGPIPFLFPPPRVFPFPSPSLLRKKRWTAVQGRVLSSRLSSLQPGFSFPPSSKKRRDQAGLPLHATFFLFLFPPPPGREFRARCPPHDFSFSRTSRWNQGSAERMHFSHVNSFFPPPLFLPFLLLISPVVASGIEKRSNSRIRVLSLLCSPGKSSFLSPPFRPCWSIARGQRRKPADSRFAARFDPPIYRPPSSLPFWDNTRRKRGRLH